MSEEWCTIESDPGVFSELIRLFGVKEIAVEEVYSLDDMNIVADEALPSTTYGYIFLFKWKKELENDGRIAMDPSEVPELFFARQIATNACATQAILGVLLNAPEIELGDSLQEFKAFSMMLDSESKGLAIGNFDQVRMAHNSFARPDPFLVENTTVTQSGEDPYHFVAFVPHNGHVFEIDGLRRGPIDLGTFDDHDWHAVARPAIQARFDKFSTSETHFALLRICTQRRATLEKRISQLESLLASCPSDDAAKRSDLEVQLEQYRGRLGQEIELETNQAAENLRRRHNYVPMVVELLTALARCGKLGEMVRNAPTKTSTSS